MSENITSDFLLKEYERISEAHFNTSNQISLFFRYYLTLMSVPALLVLYINKDITTVENIFDSTVHFPLKPHIGWLCLLISLIGLALTIYLTKLKFEHILYARTVNGIRNYFHTQDENLKQFLVLPTNTKKPSFIGFGFGSLVFVNGLVNSSYLSIGLFLLSTHCYILCGLLYLAFHIGGYLILNYFEEKKMIQLQ
jgi:hypothetical protein